MFDYIHQVIASYEITIYADEHDDECNYMDLYSNGLKNIQHNTRKNSNDSSNSYRLNIFFYDEEDAENADFNELSRIIYKKESVDYVSAANINGEIFYYIGCAFDPLTRVSKVQRILRHRNDLITEVALHLGAHYYIEGGIAEESEIGYYIEGVRSYSRCKRLSIDCGELFRRDLTTVAANNSLVSSSNHSITDLEFKHCSFNEGILSSFSPHYPYLNSLKFINCYFGHYNQLPATTAIDLLDTAVN